MTLIEVKNVSKKYGNFVAVDNISFDVKDNEVVGFLGPNGAGKSTTMNMITGYIEPSKGKIIVDGYDVSKSPRKAKKQIGYMPETVPLYSELTVKEFVNYMADLKYVKSKEKKAEVEKVLNETGLEEVKNKLIKNISRGYKQRVSMAGALIGNPKVLILDEPTVGLDPKQITEIRGLIKNLGKKHTVILSSHILSEVSQICERVVIINKGKIIAVDTPENLEENTKEANSIFLTVEDKKDNMKKIKDQMQDITSVKFIKDNKDGTKQYEIKAKENVDIRKQAFEILPKEDITIFELKKTENTLEDAFLKLIDEKENEMKLADAKEIEKEKAREEKLNNMSKAERKATIKAEKQAEKQAEKEAFNEQWEKEKAENKKEKEAKKAKKIADKKKKLLEKNKKLEEKANKVANKETKSEDKSANKETKSEDKSANKETKSEDKTANKETKTEETTSKTEKTSKVEEKTNKAAEKTTKTAKPANKNKKGGKK